MILLRYTGLLLSEIFRPSFFPLVGFAILFTITYLNMLPWQFKLWVLSAIYIFTIAIPFSLIYVIRKFNGWSKDDIYKQKRRSIVYCINIISYFWCIYVCHNLKLPSFIESILIASLVTQSLCVIANFWYKVSMRSAGSGLAIGALWAYSHIFNLDPTFWLCLTIILSGIVMSCRIFLAKHTLGEVTMGATIGITSSTLCIFLW